MELRTISLLMILYDNDLCMKQFNIAKKHYELLSDHLNMPITVYGVKYGEPGKGDYIEDNIIYLSCNTPEDHIKKDKDTLTKWMDLMKCKVLPESDVYVRISPSTILNVVLLNNCVQSKQYDPDTLYTGAMIKWNMINGADPNFKPQTYIAGRGNLLVMSKQMIQEMQKTFSEKSITEIFLDSTGTCDDQVIGAILFRIYQHKYSAFVQTAIYQDLYGLKQPIPFPQDMRDIMCIICKEYTADQNHPDIGNYILSIMNYLLNTWTDMFDLQVQYKKDPFQGNKLIVDIRAVNSWIANWCNEYIS